MDKHVRELILERQTSNLPDDDVDLQLHAIDPRDARFMKLSRRVCLIHRDDAGQATGCLVAPDLILTAAHALRGTAGIFADPATVTVMFDQFVWNKNTGTKAAGDECKLRHIPFTRQPDVVASSIKTDAKCKRQTGDNKLDYVLVRLERPMGLSFLPYSHRIRGWNDCSHAEALGDVDLEVEVVQHPFGELLKFADGTIPKEHDDSEFPQFFRYQTSTFNGSSGAPIHYRNGHLLGMHIGERSVTEQFGVSLQAILDDLKNEGVTLPPFNLTKDVMDSIFGTARVERQRHSGNDWRGGRLFDDVYGA